MDQRRSDNVGGERAGPYPLAISGIAATATAVTLCPLERSRKRKSLDFLWSFGGILLSFFSLCFFFFPPRGGCNWQFAAPAVL